MDLDSDDDAAAAAAAFASARQNAKDRMRATLREVGPSYGSDIEENPGSHASN